MDGEDKYNPVDVAASKLMSADEAAERSELKQPGNLDDVRDSEKNAKGYYSGTGKSDSTKKEVKSRGALKRYGGTATAIFSVVLALYFTISGAQSFQPFSLVEQFRETYGSMQTSSDLRSETFFRLQMSSGRVKNPIKGTLFGKNFSLTDRQKTELSKQGVEYDDATFKDGDGKPIKVLKFDDGTGEIRVVAVDDKAVEKLNALDLKKYDTDNVKFNSEAVSFKKLYMSNEDFYYAVKNGSQTWRGAISGWFNSTTASFLKRNNITRSLFKNYINEVERAEAGNTKEVAKKLMAEQAGDDFEDVGVKRKEVEAEEVKDEDGNLVPVKDNDGKIVEKDTVENAVKDKRSNIKTQSDVKSKLNNLADKYGGKSQTVVNSACIALNFLGGVSLLVSANEARQIITVAAAYFETVDKTKAGHGDETPITDLTDALNTRQKTENMVLASSGTSVDYNNDSKNIDDGGIKTLKTDIITTNKTAMESAGIAALFGNGKVKADDPNVRSFNFSGNIKTLLGGLGTSMAAFKTCSLAKIAVNSISAFKSGVEAAGCIAGLLGSVATFGASGVAGCGPLIANVIKGVAVGVGISMVLSGIIATITPIVASALTRDIISDLGGESLGNALTFGANMYMGGTHRANGGSLMTKEKYVEFAAKQQGVIADNARFERLRLSPFDSSSKYTFMGSIMRQLMAFSTASSLMGIVSSGSSVVSSSLLALNNSTASAVDISKNLYTDEEYDEICSNLADIGAVGDADCNPYSGTDISTMELDPVDVVDKLEKEGNFEEQSDDDGIVDKVVNKTIKAGSKLAKYILLCGDRWSYGVADQNIINEVTNGFRVSSGNSAIDTVSNSAIGAIPVIGDVVDILSDNVALRNIGYISGASCVAGNKVNAADSPNWEEAKYYQRFIEDQTLAESMGYIVESAVTAFLKKYFSENPIDNSYEGMLARYSGLDKETVTDILDVLAYYDYVANYHPEERYAFGTPAVQTKEELRFDNENRLGNVDSILLNEISFADVRNRSFAV